MDSHLVAESIDLLLYGMGIVFAFLILLVLATSVMSSLITRYFPEPEVVKPHGQEEVPSTDVDPLTLKAIQAALDKHRNRK